MITIRCYLAHLFLKTWDLYLTKIQKQKVKTKIESVETTASIVTETFQAEEKILPNEAPDKQYEFATSFLKVGDYPTAERAFRNLFI